MSIITARAAFAKGLGTAGSVNRCTMNYVRVEGRQVSRFLVVYHKNANQQIAYVDVAPGANTETVMFEAGQTAAQGE